MVVRPPAFMPSINKSSLGYCPKFGVHFCVQVRTLPYIAPIGRHVKSQGGKERLKTRKIKYKILGQAPTAAVSQDLGISGRHH